MTNDNSFSKNINIHIVSLIKDLTDVENGGNTDYDERIEFSKTGTLTVKGNIFEITYKENEDLGMADIESTLRFKKDRPTMINLIRRGSAPASLMFDTEFPRRSGSYCLGNIPFSFFICTNDVINTCSENSGKIVLDYEIEMQGMKTEHNIFTLEYKE